MWIEHCENLISLNEKVYTASINKGWAKECEFIIPRDSFTETLFAAERKFPCEKRNVPSCSHLQTLARWTIRRNAISE